MDTTECDALPLVVISKGADAHDEPLPFTALCLSSCSAGERNTEYRVSFYPLFSTLSLSNEIALNQDSMSSVYTFSISLDHDKKLCHFGSAGDFIIPHEMRNRGFATYALSQIIRWAKLNASGYHYKALSLSVIDEQSEDKGLYRNKLYKNHNFIIELFEDNGTSRYQCSPGCIDDLCTVDTVSFFDIDTCDNYIKKLSKHRNDIHNRLYNIERGLNQRNDVYTSVTNTLRSKCRFYKITSFSLMLLLVIIAVSSGTSSIG